MLSGMEISWGIYRADAEPFHVQCSGVAKGSLQTYKQVKDGYLAREFQRIRSNIYSIT